MTFGRLLLRNLRFHWRGNFAVLLGVAVGTAVLTGALLVGDSLRGSLHDQTAQRLGWVDHALIAPRFFHEGVAQQLQSAPPVDGERIEGVIVLQGSVPAADGPARARARSPGSTPAAPRGRRSRS